VQEGAACSLLAHCMSAPTQTQVPELDVNSPDYTIPCFEKKLFSMITDEVREPWSGLVTCLRSCLCLLMHV
jgi:hypothetical protein